MRKQVKVIRHAKGPVCESCNKKLKQADKRIADWFLDVKLRFDDVHVSWSYRGMKEQNEFYAERRSNAPFPMSKHNTSDVKGNPSSQALDLFQLASNGMACWNYKYFKAISDYSKSIDASILWGGDFKDDKLGDYSHFEVKLSIPASK